MRCTTHECGCAQVDVPTGHLDVDIIKWLEDWLVPFHIFLGQDLHAPHRDALQEMLTQYILVRFAGNDDKENLEVKSQVHSIDEERRGP